MLSTTLQFFRRVIGDILLLAGLALILTGTGWALAASNTVPVTAAVDNIVQDPITANDLKPPECAALNLLSVVDATAANADNSANLIIGGPGPDTINAKGGDDCVLGGGGDDDLDGGTGNDILLGYAGNDTLTGRKDDDTLNGGPDVDVCTGGPGPGTDSYDPSCETQN